MATPLRVLILEDQPADAELVLYELGRQGFAPDWRRADTMDGLIEALEWGPEVILCDYSMPHLDALQALHVILEKGLDIPFIVVSGSIGDDLATSIVKAGADDYLLKDRLGRIGSSVEHAIRERRLRADKRRIEEDLRQSEARFRSAFENAPVGMLLVGVDGSFLMSNRSISEMLGYSQEEFEDLDYRAITHPDDMDKSREAIRRILAGDEDYLSLEKRYLHKDGQTVWGHVTALLLREPDRTPLYFVAHVLDVTQRKQNVERIEKLNRMYAVLSQVDEAIVRAKDRQKLLEDACRIIVEQGRVPMTWAGFEEPETRRILPAAWHGCEEGYFEGMVFSADPEVPEGLCPVGSAIREGRSVVVHAIPPSPPQERPPAREYRSHGAFPIFLQGRAAGVICVSAAEAEYFDDDIVKLLGELSSDLSYALDAMAGAEALRRSEQRYRNLFQRSMTAVVRVSGEGRILDCNPAFMRLAGVEDIEQVKAANIGDYYAHPEDRQRFLGTLAASGSITNQEVEFIRPDGGLVTLLLSANMLAGDSPSQTVIEAYAVDITEMREGERERRLLSTAVEQGHEAVMVTDTEGRILYVNPAFETLSGYTRAELHHKSPRLLKSGTHDQPFYADLWATLLKGRVWSGHLVNKRKNGSLYTVHSIISPILDEKGTLTTFVAAQRDVSEELRMQEGLERARKLETIGMITGGVAHEVRNPLFALSTVASALATKLDERDECRVYTEHINVQVRRLSQLMNDLLVFGKPIEPAEFWLFSAQEALRSALAQAEAGGLDVGGRIVLEIPEEPQMLHGNADKIEQAFLNLVQNAIHLSPPSEPVTVRLRPNGADVRVDVEDRGPGIPDDFLPKLFEPFASRRKGGTGLGLAIVTQIVSAHGGSVSARNNTPRPGATFTVTLPRHHPS